MPGSTFSVCDGTKMIIVTIVTTTILSIETAPQRFSQQQFSYETNFIEATLYLCDHHLIDCPKRVMEISKNMITVIPSEQVNIDEFSN